MHSCFWCHKIILKTLIDIIARTFARIRNNTLRAYVRFHPCSARALPCVHSHQLTQTLSCLMERLVLTAFRLSHQLTAPSFLHSDSISCKPFLQTDWLFCENVEKNAFCLWISGKKSLKINGYKPI